MRSVSAKRAKAIASGGMKLNGRSTFKQMTAEEYREQKSAEAIEIRAALYGKPAKVKTDRQRAAAAADKWFSMFIRLRDSDANGIATCITSGKRAHWRTMDCGHYVSRAKQATRYDEHNAHAQGKMSNRFQGGHFVEHGNAIDRIHGEGTAKALREKGLMRCSRTTSDFLFIADTYRRRVEWIAEHEPGKFNRP